MTDVADTLLPIKTAGAGPAVFCVHPISGSAYMYAALAPRLTAAHDIYGLEAPGFDDGRDPLTTLDGLSAEYIQILRQFRPDGPYYLLGYSMGGAVAFDMAQRLSAAGMDVPMLVIIDTAVPKKMERPTESAMLARFVRDMMWVSGMPAGGSNDVIGKLGGTGPASFLAEVERAAIFPPEMDAEFLRNRYRVFRAHIGALFDYEARGTYHGHVVLQKAAGTPAETMVWTDLASDVEEHLIPGDHYSIWTGLGLQRMSEIIGRSLDTDQHACIRGEYEMSASNRGQVTTVDEAPTTSAGQDAAVKPEPARLEPVAPPALWRNGDFVALLGG